MDNRNCVSLEKLNKHSRCYRVCIFIFPCSWCCEGLLQNIIVIFFYNYSKESFIITVRWGTFERFQVCFLIATVWFALEAQFSQLINSQWYSVNVSLSHSSHKLYLWKNASKKLFQVTQGNGITLNKFKSKEHRQMNIHVIIQVKKCMSST